MSDQEALSADIHLLGDLLGETIRRLAGDEVFNLVEEVRASAKQLRLEHSLEDARRLRDRLDRLDLARLRGLTRAFSTYFDLINLAEQQARIRVLREREAKGIALNESPEAALRLLGERGVDQASLNSQLQHALIVPVFTAHPSEARRRTILEKLAAIGKHLERATLADPLPDERAEALAGIAEEIEELWLTDTACATRPTVRDEVRQVFGSPAAACSTSPASTARSIRAPSRPSEAGPNVPTLFDRGSEVTVMVIRVSPSAKPPKQFSSSRRRYSATTSREWTTSGESSVIPNTS